ncbi:ankyrin repeat domain-containing protein 17 [Plakobranchus ocellatus]|uniref:Ankyrin repeat domain-containing protein 17 n=1 Tax=Plakobranchus ocellatus TaxID=259542 RepID=A0AAV4E0B3_9GAST|nr:ankyrin repeat domain-containing protein 17 [Plakobranchus ocellatus]
MLFHCLALRSLDETLILAALRDENLSEVAHLLEGMDILSKPLSETCRAGLKSCLVKWITSTTKLDPLLRTVLRPAIVSGSIESVEALLNRGAHLNFLYRFRHSVLVVAIAHVEKPDVMQMVKFLVEKGANFFTGDAGYSPLVVATLKHPDVVLYLLQNGADVNEKGDKLGNMPLTAALYYNKCRSSTYCHSIVKILLSAALHWAFDAETVSLLIQAGADLEARDDDGRTTLLDAAFKGKTDVVSVLKKYGADMAAVDKKSDFALHIMVNTFDYRHEETLRLFSLQCNLTNRQGMTPLMIAVQRRPCINEAVRILLELGADPNIVNGKSGQTHTALSIVLHEVGRTCNSSDLACAEYLIIRNSVNSLPRCCWYFFEMIERDQCRLVQLMVTHGMAPLCEKIQTIENWFLTPADLVGSLELRQLRNLLERQSQADSLRFMDENLSQPMSLKKLNLVAVSAQLGGVAGREQRVSQTPLPNILKDMLLCRREDLPMDFTD